MPQLSTGFIIAGAYADKLRRVLFAQLRDKIKAGEIDSHTVAARASELNRLLFDILVNRLKTNKNDVVRVKIDYDVVDGDIHWKLDRLQVEVFRRVEADKVAEAVREAVSKAGELLSNEPSREEKEWVSGQAEEGEHTRGLSFEPKGSTHWGTVYLLRRGDANVGAAIVSEFLGSYLAKVVLAEPPMTGVGTGATEEEAIRTAIGSLKPVPKNVAAEEIRKIYEAFVGQDARQPEPAA